MTEFSSEKIYLAQLEVFARHRFVEAAETMAYMQVRHGPSSKSGSWPGVADKLDGDYLERYRPNAAAISRAYEVLHEWLLDFVPDEEHRVIIGHWSACMAKVNPHYRSFRQFCKKTGRNRTTADARLNVAFQSVANGLRNSPKPLRSANGDRTGPLLGGDATDLDTVAEAVVAKHESFWRADDAKPTHRPDMQDQAA